MQGTGVGVPSISIYASELITEFGAKQLLRVGTCFPLGETRRGEPSRFAFLPKFELAVLAASLVRPALRRLMGRTAAPFAFSNRARKTDREDPRSASPGRHSVFARHLLFRPGHRKRLESGLGPEERGGLIVLNAIQAMPRGGELSLRGSRDDSTVRLVFSDTGRGFSGEALARHGELFFSEREGGMGIGLNVSMEILRAHGGRLEVSNRGVASFAGVSLPEPGSVTGAVVLLELPVCSP